jgi:hypothetical protein
VGVDVGVGVVVGTGVGMLQAEMAVVSMMKAQKAGFSRRIGVLSPGMEVCQYGILLLWYVRDVAIGRIHLPQLPGCLTNTALSCNI